MGLKFELPRIDGSFTRSRLNLTESALKSSPLWNLTPLRSLISHTVGASELRQLGGERGDQLEVLVTLDQRVVEVGRHHRGRRLLLVHGVERSRVHALGDDHLAFRSGRNRYGSREGDERDGERRAETCPHHVFLLE